VTVAPEPEDYLDRYAKKLGKYGLIAAGSLLTFVAAVVIIYVWWFAFRLDLPLSTEPDAWGQFGDYLAGTLNPILTFATTLLLIATLVLQWWQTADGERRALLSELNALAAQISGRMEAILDAPLNPESPLFSKVSLPETLRTCLPLIAKSAKAPGIKPSLPQHLCAHDTAALLRVHAMVGQLYWCLAVYEQLKSDGYLPTFYRVRYASDIRRLSDIGFKFEPGVFEFLTRGFSDASVDSAVV
jgi:hypothetical protein